MISPSVARAERPDDRRPVLFLRNRTEPSHISTLAPPEWKLAMFTDPGFWPAPVPLVLQLGYGGFGALQHITQTVAHDAVGPALSHVDGVAAAGCRPAPAAQVRSHCWKAVPPTGIAIAAVFRVTPGG